MRQCYYTKVHMTQQISRRPVEITKPHPSFETFLFPDSQSSPSSDCQLLSGVGKHAKIMIPWVVVWCTYMIPNYI